MPTHHGIAMASCCHRAAGGVESAGRGGCPRVIGGTGTLATPAVSWTLGAGATRPGGTTRGFSVALSGRLT